MNNTEKQQQADSYISTLNGIVAKMEANETNMASSQPMTDEPYILRQDLTLLRRNIALFSAAELPALTKVQHDAKPTLVGDEYDIAGIPISKGEGQNLTILKWSLDDVLESTVARFNQHLVNLRPHWYRNKPESIRF